MSNKTTFDIVPKQPAFCEKNLVGDRALKPIVQYQEDWVRTSGKMHSWPSQPGCSIKRRRRRFSQKERSWSRQVPDWAFWDMDLWEVWDGLNLENQLYRARGVVALVAPIQCSTGWWLEVLQCHQTCGLILLTGSLTATKTGGAPLLGLLSVSRLKKQIPTNPISWSPLTWR